MPVYENKGNYLYIEINELYSLKLVISAIHEIGKICRKDGLNQVLANLENMKGHPRTMDRYDMGVEVATVLGSKIKLAVVAAPHLINLMAENVAVNRGAKLKVFDDMDQALKWLGVAE